MKCRFSKHFLTWLVPLVLAPAGGAAWAIDFKAVDVGAAIMYDAPSTKSRKLFLLKRHTPVEVVVGVEGFIKVREPEGAIGWIEKKALTDKRQVIVTAARAQVRLTGASSADVVFEAEKGVALELVEPAKEGWIKVRHIDGPVGMVHVTQVWGS